MKTYLTLEKSISHKSNYDGSIYKSYVTSFFRIPNLIIQSMISLMKKGMYIFLKFIHSVKKG